MKLISSDSSKTNVIKVYRQNDDNFDGIGIVANLEHPIFATHYRRANPEILFFDSWDVAVDYLTTYHDLIQAIYQIDSSGTHEVTIEDIVRTAESQAAHEEFQHLQHIATGQW